MSRGGSREVEKLSISDLSYSPYLTIIDKLKALITSLFSAGEQGAFYIPRPVVNGTQALFQDAAGTVAVTADGDPDGLMIDQSRTASTPRSLQAQLSLHTTPHPTDYRWTK